MINKMKDQDDEEQYQEMGEIDHILLRTDLHLGKVKPDDCKRWVFDLERGLDKDYSSKKQKKKERDENETEEKEKQEQGCGTIKEEEFMMSDGLIKIFDEIAVNASDMVIKSRNKKDKSERCTRIRFSFNRKTNEIIVENNGKPIRIEKQKDLNGQDTWIPELIFGRMRTSSNYDDSKERKAGGKNGLGAKLANVFSKKFTVEISDKTRRKYYKQTWSNNMKERSDPLIQDGDRKKDFVRVTFTPDYERFGCDGLNDFNLSVLYRRVFDIAAYVSFQAKTFLNDDLIPIENFYDYCIMYQLEDSQSKKRIFEKCNEDWEIVVGIGNGDEFKQVSFVNGLNLNNGGTHVEEVKKIICKELQGAIESKTKVKLTPAQISTYLFLWINCKINQPEFDGNAKTTLKSKPSTFGSSFVLRDCFKKKLLSSSFGLIQTLEEVAKRLDAKLLKKTDGTKKKPVLDELDDAIEAGGKNSKSCTLFLTEGKSAKAMICSGLNHFGERGRRQFGVFALRGKVVNAKDTISTIAKNKEFANIKKILGLVQGCKYETEEERSNLRYGKIVFATDQDHDGSHIRGLLINLFETFWPALLKHVAWFRTPIMKVTFLDKSLKTIPFYSQEDFKTWQHETKMAPSNYKVKYYKGLATSTNEEAKEYFEMYEHCLIEFECDKDYAKNVSKAFDKKKSDLRKEWIGAAKASDVLDHSKIKRLPISDFINTELVQFSIYNNLRVIANLNDGLKPGQRKVLASLFKRKQGGQKEIKVSALGGFVTETMAYHHGPAALEETIVGMAADFVGSNNFPLLEPIGQFGTRKELGDDHGAPRYINTKLSPLARALFPEQDDAVLERVKDDGQMVEPVFFSPIVPYVLINGSKGIGVGWSSTIPSFSYKDVLENVRIFLREFKEGEDEKFLLEKMVPMRPWIRGFTGHFDRQTENPKKFKMVGSWEKLGEKTLQVKEIPTGKLFSKYEKELSELKGADKILKNVEALCTNNKVDYRLIFHDSEKMDKWIESGKVEEKLKLIDSKTNLNNMVLFDHDRRIKRFEDERLILIEFAKKRLMIYQLRKEHMLEVLRKKQMVISNQARFIEMVNKEELRIRNQPKLKVIEQLEFYKFDKENEEEEGEGENKQEEEEEAGKTEKKTGYEYLLRLAIHSLTLERAEKLKKQKIAKDEEIKELKQKDVREIWRKELEALEVRLDEYVKESEARIERERLDKKNNKRKSEGDCREGKRRRVEK